MSTTKQLAEFRASREAINRLILDQGIKRFFTVAIKAHPDSTLNSRTKEFAKLTASLMLQCDDCISYHVVRCRARGLSCEEMFEVFNDGSVVGGSIVMPHSGRAGAPLDEIEENE